MTRCKATAILTLLLLAAVVLLVAPHDAAASSTLRARLQAARHRLSDARIHLAAAQATLDKALADAATPTPAPTPSPTPAATPEPTTSPGPTLEQLRARVAHCRLVVRRVHRTVLRLAHRYEVQRQLTEWERDGRWGLIIRYAAARYHVSADGIHRMMLLESGGRRFAGAYGPFKGLFQYHMGTWTSGWNPWRHDSIFDASSQIFATCLAVHKGYGPSMWPVTYAMSF